MKVSVKKFLVGMSLITTFSSVGFAGGFKLPFQSTSVLADGGDAAVVEDAGTNWYNAAGNVYIPQQLVLSTMGVYTSSKFSGTTTAPSIVGGAPFIQGGRASSYSFVTLPGFHYVYPFWCKYAFGLSIAPAWGLLEDYGPKSFLRYTLDRVYTRSIIIAPSFSMKINDHWSFGLGPDFHYWYISQNLHVRTQPVTLNDSISRISGRAWGYGGHFGVLYRLNEKTRFGLNYRTRIVMNMRGYSTFLFDNLDGFETGNFKLNIPMPPVTTFSAYHELNPCWAIMGTVAYDQWTVIRAVNGRNFIGPGGILADVSIPQRFNNTFDLAVGAHYKVNDAVLLRGSLKYVQTPTTNEARDVNFPDADKLGVNVGSRIRLQKELWLDLLYTHVFFRTVSINSTNSFTANANGRSRNSVDIAGAQLVYNIT